MQSSPLVINEAYIDPCSGTMELQEVLSQFFLGGPIYSKYKYIYIYIAQYIHSSPFVYAQKPNILSSDSSRIFIYFDAV